MIDWSLLPTKFGKRKGAKKFEDLALLYVKSVYSQYDWTPTGGSHDGNKDAHVGKDAEFDIWEEAKFKSDKYTLRRQDLDPTILSGLIQGNVRLIIFVSNAHLPEQLLSRSIIGARIRGIEISCVLGKQLESWLLRHPDCYEIIFEDKLPFFDKDNHIIEIHESTFFDIYSTDFNPFTIRKEMIVGEEYILSITLFSSGLSSASLVVDEFTPFILIQHPNFDDPDNMRLVEGVCVFTFLVRTNMPFCGGINIRFIIDDEPYFHVTDEVIIQKCGELGITYTQQLEVIDAIKAIISFQPPVSVRQIISIFAESGMGKSYVLKSIYTDYVLKRDMTIVCFESHEQNNTNDLFLCRIILFLNYGNIFWGARVKTPEDIENFKRFSLSRNTGSLFSNDLLEELIDGCFYEKTAVGVINKLFLQAKQDKCLLIRGSKSKLGRILLLDDFHFLNKKQTEFISMLCKQTMRYGQSNIIIISATDGKFRDKETDKCFQALTPSTLVLHGLADNDKATTLCHNFGLSFAIAGAISKQILPSSPLLASEILRIIHTNHKKSDDIIGFLSAYSTQTQSSVLLQNRFIGLDDKFYLLDIIYRFNRGIDNSFLYKYDKFERSKIDSDVKTLAGRGLIKLKETYIMPYHDFYILSYKQLRKNKFFNRHVGRYLNYLLHTKDCTKYFDEAQLLSQLIRCGLKYFQAFEGKIKEQILLNIHATNFSTALYYCEYYHEILKLKDSSKYTSEEFYYLYLYSDCLVHCGINGAAEKMLEKVHKLSAPDSMENAESGASLLNQQFWNMNIEKIICNSYIMQMNAESILKTEISEEDYRRLRKAEDTCHNRRMVTQLLLDCYDDAEYTYRNRLSMIANESKGDAFKSRAATLIMDYARGRIYTNPAQALHLMRVAMRFFECRSQEHIRRLLLCRVDFIVMQSITNECLDKKQLRSLIGELLDGQFYSESFKTLLKYHACKIVEAFQYIERVAGSDSDIKSSIITDEAVSEIYSFMTEIGIVPTQREKFLFDNLMAFINVKNGNLAEAVSNLDYICEYIAPAGNSYRAIAEHNKSNIGKINKIRWCTKDTPFSQDTFLLDCRFW